MYSVCAQCVPMCVCAQCACTVVTKSAGSPTAWSDCPAWTFYAFPSWAFLGDVGSLPVLSRFHPPVLNDWTSQTQPT